MVKSKLRLELKETKPTKKNNAYIKKLKPKKPAIRKPRDLDVNAFSIASVIEGFYCYEQQKDIPVAICINNESLKPKQARKLAAWLLKAADYIEQSTKKESI